MGSPKKDYVASWCPKLANSQLFDNLLSMEELLVVLRHQYSRATIYRWKQQGMPCVRLKGKLWFPKDEIFLWMKRSTL